MRLVNQPLDYHVGVRGILVSLILVRVSPKTGAPHRNLGELVLVLDEWLEWLE